MLEKKLLTVACALGILLCGACFLPPAGNPPPRPPLTPPLIASRGVHSICVKVENLSATGHIDSNLVLGWIVGYINSYDAAGWPRAARCDGPISIDVTLQISISNESATAEEADSASPEAGYRYSAQVDAVLTARDGRVLWREASPIHQSRRFPAPGSADPWKSIAVETWLHYDVCHSLVRRVLNEEP